MVRAREDEMIENVFLSGFFLRGLGLILLGAGLYRTGFMNGGMAGRASCNSFTGSG